MLVRKEGYEAGLSECIGRVTEPRKLYSCGPARKQGYPKVKAIGKADNLHALEGSSPRSVMVSGQDTTGV